MPKITDAQYVADANGTGYIIGYQDGVFCRWPITMAVANKWLSGSGTPNVGSGVNDDYYLDISTGDVYQKTDGAWGTAVASIRGADGTDGVGVPIGGITGQVLAKKSATDYDYEWVNATTGDNEVVDLSSATSDYALAVGETAKIVYLSATSIQLHIETEEGVYELRIVGDKTGSTSTGDVLLRPNNATTSGIVGRYNNNSSQTQTTSMTEFLLGVGKIYCSDVLITTGNGSKNTVKSNSISDDNSVVRFYEGMFWQNSLVWTSLGTITFPFAQTGTIMVKRVL